MSNPVYVRQYSFFFEKVAASIIAMTVNNTPRANPQYHAEDQNGINDSPALKRFMTGYINMVGAT